MADKKLRFEVEADVDKAKDDLGDVADAADDLEGRKVEVPVEVDTERAEAQVKDVLDDLDKLTKSDPTVKVDIRVDDAALDRARGKLKATGDQAGSTVGPLRDVSGAFGGVGQGAIDAGDALIGFGETIGTLSPKLGGLGATLGKVGFIGAAAAIGAGVITEVVKVFQSGSEKLAKAVEDMSARVVAAQGDVDKAFKSRAMEEWSDDMIDAMGDVGLTFDDVSQAANGKFTPAVQRLQRVLASMDLSSGVAPDMREFAAAMGITTDEAFRMIGTIQTVAGHLTREGIALDTSTEAWADRSRFFGDALTEQSTALDTAALSVTGYGDGIRSTTDIADEFVQVTAAGARAAEDEAAAFDLARDALADLNTALDARRGGILGEAEARVALAEAQERYNEAVADEQATVDERVVAAQHVAEGFADVMGAMAAAKGEGFDRDAAILNSLKATAEQADGPTKDAINNVIAALEAVPKTTPADVVVNNADALREINEVSNALTLLKSQAASAAFIAAGAIGGFTPSASQSVGVTQNITVNAGFGTDAFAVQSAVLNASRQAARLARGALRNA